MMPTFTPHIPVPRPSYSQARENLVKAIPPKLLCLLACGGKDCRYEGPECWKLNQQVIRGLFSSWVTDDIIAMARPSNHLIEKYNIIEQFQRLNIKSIINMQLPGEHAHCGPPLDPESGFTYSPQSFMENDMKEGRVAVHCHAGLGRTGVLIACYLIYTLRISPSEAVHFVRIKRPCSIQTRAQITQVFDFARLLCTQLVQYPDLSLRHGAPFTLQHYLNRQALLLHGQEGRALRQTPKVLYLLCVRLSCLALGLPTPPEVYAELEKRSALRTLSRTVRETLVAKHYLPLLREQHRGSWVSSVSSWDEPLGFLDRKREVLLDKRSYSDSDLSKITVNKDLELSPYCITAFGKEKHPDRRPISPVLPRPPGLPATKNEYQTVECIRNSNNCTKRSKCTAKMLHTKYNSNMELCRNLHNPGSTLVARTVAKAMADQGPPGETILQRSALLQEELNSSDCGWALLVTESDPHVLSCLLWTWLERLRDPVLGSEDVGSLSCGANYRKPLNLLKKSQKHTIYCLLSCVSAVTRLCPHKEEAVLRRLIRALTRRPQEEIGSLTALIKILKTSLGETFHSNRYFTGVYITNATL
ncbi:hypothetical protein Q8A73_004686 [Channa argus]|nr:hypothetical protein Q8A73_004686 [Channa argus]